MWKPLYLSKTSGTTSGAKYSYFKRVNADPHHRCTRCFVDHIHSTGKTDFLSGKQIFLKGIQLWKKRRNRAGATFRNRCPLCALVSSKESNAELGNKLHRRLEEKVDAIVEETLPEKMTLIGGILLGSNVF